MQRCRPSTRNIVRCCFWHLSLVLSVDLSDTTQQNWVYLIQLRQHQLRKQLDAVGSTRQSGLVNFAYQTTRPGQGQSYCRTGFCFKFLWHVKIHSFVCSVSLRRSGIVSKRLSISSNEIFYHSVTPHSSFVITEQHYEILTVLVLSSCDCGRRILVRCPLLSFRVLRDTSWQLHVNERVMLFTVLIPTLNTKAPYIIQTTCNFHY